MRLDHRRIRVVRRCLGNNWMVGTAIVVVGSGAVGRDRTKKRRGKEKTHRVEILVGARDEQSREGAQRVQFSRSCD